MSGQLANCVFAVGLLSVYHFPFGHQYSLTRTVESSKLSLSVRCKISITAVLICGFCAASAFLCHSIRISHSARLSVQPTRFFGNSDCGRAALLVVLECNSTIKKGRTLPTLSRLKNCALWSSPLPRPGRRPFRSKSLKFITDEVVYPLSIRARWK